MSKKIKFTDEFFGEQFDESDKEMESFAIMEEEGGMDGAKRLAKVNPRLFRRLKFLVSVEPDALLPKTEAFERALKLEAAAQLINILGPSANREGIATDFVIDSFPFAKGNSDK